MFKRRRNFQNRLNSQVRNTTPFGYCVCPNCQYSIPHKRGVPCVSNTCPHCHTALVRSDQPGTNSTPSPQNTVKGPRQTGFPKVDDQICIGCGTCVEKCPCNAIQLVDGTAQIDTSICKSCRACVKICPVGAIS